MQMLSQVGVDRIKVGNPVVRKVASNIEHLVKLKNRPKLLCHIRNRMDDLEVRISFNLGGTASTKEVTQEVIKNYREIYDHS